MAKVERVAESSGQETFPLFAFVFISPTRYFSYFSFRRVLFYFQVSQDGYLGYYGMYEMFSALYNFYFDVRIKDAVRPDGWTRKAVYAEKM